MKNPSMLIVIIAVLTSAAVSIILVVQNNRRKSAIRELNNAARKIVKEQLSTGGKSDHWVVRYAVFCLRFVAPIAMLFIFLFFTGLLGN